MTVSLGLTVLLSLSCRRASKENLDFSDDLKGLTLTAELSAFAGGVCKVEKQNIF